MPITVTSKDWKISTLGGGQASSYQQVAHAVTCHQVKGGDPTTDNYVVTGGSFDGPTHSLTHRYDSSEDGCGRGTPLVPFEGAVAIRTAQTSANGHGVAENVAHTLDGAQGQAVAFTQNQVGDVLSGDVMHSLGTNQNATGRNAANITQGMAVRRLTPAECERLQGFPDNYTKISDKTADGPRYKSLGNSMAVPVMRWIGERISEAEGLTR